MFNIGAAELILLLLIAFIVVGPKDLPRIARFLGRTVRRIRGMINEIKRETGFDELEQELRETQKDLQQTIRDTDIREDLRGTEKELRSEINGIRRDMRTDPVLKDAGKDSK